MNETEAEQRPQAIPRPAVPMHAVRTSARQPDRHNPSQADLEGRYEQ